MLSGHRRRINTEEKAKVVAALWGAEFVQFLSALAVFTVKRFEEYDELQQDDLKKRMNSSDSSKSSLYKINGAARNLIHSVPQTQVTTFAFASVFILLLWCVHMYECMLV